MKHIIFCIILVTVLCATAQVPPGAEEEMESPAGVWAMPGTDDLVVAKAVVLPVGEDWTLKPAAAQATAKEMYLDPMYEAGPGWYRFVAVVRSGTKVLHVAAHDAAGKKSQKIVIDLATAEEEAGEEMHRLLREARAMRWMPYAAASDAVALKAWTARGQSESESWRGRRDDRPVLTAFSLFGGRAAVQETVQLQDLQVDAQAAEEATVPIDGMAGVEVKAHPFAEMLAGAPGGSLALADLVPADHFFVYVQKPDALKAFLDGGSGFIGRAAGLIGSGCTDYGLETRYLARLGVDRKWLDLFLGLPVIKEIGVIVPDLYLIEGTEMTAVARVSAGKELAAALALVGLKGLEDGARVERDIGGGRKAYWALRGDVLIASTSAKEIDLVLALEQAAGAGSLGRSDEFRYMLTQLPIKPGTRMYAYLSDPFIRRLVSPAFKIGQLRRINARADLEYVTSAALLARMEKSSAATVADLAGAAYLPERYVSAGYTIDSDLVAHSPVWGTVADLKTLTEVPVTHATPSEAEAYRQYLENYNRFWRQYFDPIAIRLDDAPGGAMEANVFILPLIESSAYNSLRESLQKEGAAEPLRAPDITPKPVVMLSVNLSDKTWREMERGLTGGMREEGMLMGGGLGLGPGLHLAVHDTSPVLALGSGDLLGAFGGDLAMAGGEMIFVPALLSMLTHPCELFIEARDPEATRRALTTVIQMMTGEGRMGRGPELAVDHYGVAGREEWVYTFGIFGLFKLRYAVEVRDGYLIVRNIPWAERPQIKGVELAGQGDAQLRITPSAAKLELPGLFASAEEASRASAFQGMGSLYPIVASGYAGMDNAGDACMRLFGYRPLHPAGGAWVWEGSRLKSTRYGSVWAPVQPEYDAGKEDLGLFESIGDASVSMQFEDAGLRATVRWSAVTK